jgi:hypothetical protein
VCEKKGIVMPDKFYPEILLSGKHFSPKKLVADFRFSVDKVHERGDCNAEFTGWLSDGSCAMRPSRDIDGLESSVDHLLKQYAQLHSAGLKKYGIDTTAFYLNVAGEQERDSLSSTYLAKICRFFDDVNVAFTTVEPAEESAEAGLPPGDN